MNIVYLLFCIILLFLIVLCLAISGFFLYKAFKKRTYGKLVILYSILTLFFLYFSYSIYKTDWNSSENEDGKESEVQFKNNFGFSPPTSVKSIKYKYSGVDIIDYWMAFTYDSATFEKILKNDQSIDSVTFGTEKYNELYSDLTYENKDQPNWFKEPNTNTKKIFHKENYIKSSQQSSFCIWVNENESTVFLKIKDYY